MRPLIDTVLFVTEIPDSVRPEEDNNFTMTRDEVSKALRNGPLDERYVFFNAPRPLAGHTFFNGPFRKGVFYGAVRPDLDYCEQHVIDNINLDAALCTFVPWSTIDRWIHHEAEAYANKHPKGVSAERFLHFYGTFNEACKRYYDAHNVIPSDEVLAMFAGDTPTPPENSDDD